LWFDKRPVYANLPPLDFFAVQAIDRVLSRGSSAIFDQAIAFTLSRRPIEINTSQIHFPAFDIGKRFVYVFLCVYVL
jgi:hypothetical protein